MLSPIPGPPAEGNPHQWQGPVGDQRSEGSRQVSSCTERKQSAVRRARTGESARSDEAQSDPLGPWTYWRRDGCEVSESYPRRSVGPRRWR